MIQQSAILCHAQHILYIFTATVLHMFNAVVSKKMSAVLFTSNWLCYLCWWPKPPWVMACLSVPPLKADLPSSQNCHFILLNAGILFLSQLKGCRNQRFRAFLRSMMDFVFSELLPRFTGLQSSLLWPKDKKNKKRMLWGLISRVSLGNIPAARSD